MPDCPLICCRLDYPGIGPEHSYLKDLGRAEYFAVTDEQALESFVRVSRLEGIIPALGDSACICPSGQALPHCARWDQDCHQPEREG